MKYIVMECFPSYAVLLDEEGRFFKAANLHYQVGQAVFDPVLMKEVGRKKRPALRWLAGGIAAAAACCLLFFGVAYYQNYCAPYTELYLTINPEVQIDLNRQGGVVGLSGQNEEGAELVEGYDARGKDKVEVTGDLIDRAIDLGYLSEGGKVSIAIDAPEEALFEEYGVELRTGVTEHLDGRLQVTVEIVSYDAAAPEPEKTPAPTQSVAPEPSAEPTPAATPVYLPQDDTDYSDTGYGPNADGVTDYDDTDYGPNADGVTDYGDTDYGPNADGDTDYDDTDYGPNADGVTDYDDTDYGQGGGSQDDDTDYGDRDDGRDDDDTDYDDRGDDDDDDGD